jgi:dihydroxy-acid dehydratase|tara:strand:- start:747 stop:920 length:174 start_codon:yes stop_codon:yes gene_type:complete
MIQYKHIDLINCWEPPEGKASRGYAKLFTQHVTQAHEGCDFDFLQGTPGETPEPDIF